MRLSRLGLLAAALIAFALPLTTFVQAQMSHTDGYSQYARVHRNDGSYRDMYISDSAVQALQQGQPIPEGTVIQMETYYRPDQLSTIFVKQWNGSEWLWGAYGAGRPLPAFEADMSCTGCHRRSAEPEGTYTMPQIERFVSSSQIQEVFCDQPGRSPCGPETYEQATGILASR